MSLVRCSRTYSAAVHTIEARTGLVGARRGSASVPRVGELAFRSRVTCDALEMPAVVRRQRFGVVRV